MKFNKFNGKNAVYVTVSRKVTYVLQQKGIVTLAGQFAEFWKNGLLPFDPAKITTNYVVGEDGTEIPDFERVMLRKSAKYYHNCHI